MGEGGIMADMEEMLDWAGFTSSWDLIKSKMKEEDFNQLLQDLWEECEYKEEIVGELLHDEGYVDIESIRADYDDYKYQEWKDRNLE